MAHETQETDMSESKQVSAEVVQIGTKVVDATTRYYIFEAEHGLWQCVYAADTWDEATALAAELNGPTCIVRIDLPAIP